MSSSSNPYRPPEIVAERGRIEAVQILPVTFPDAVTDCEFFTYEEFARLFEIKLHGAFKPFGIPTLDALAQPVGNQKTARISCYVQQITDYRIDHWNFVKKWFLPILSYRYRAASFEILGQIESDQIGTVPFRLYRKFARGRLAFERRNGEKANMLVGMDAEAARVAALLLKRDTVSGADNESSFWPVLLLVPLAVAVTLASVVYLVQQTDGETRYIRTGLAFLASWLLTIAGLPTSIYRHPNAAYFYQVTAAKSHLQLRGFPFIIGFIAMAFAVASFIYGDE